MMLNRIFITLCAVFTLIFSGTAIAEDRMTKAEQLVSSLVERIQTTVEKDPTPQEIRAETDLIIDEFFDYNLVARFAAGQAWRSATKDERAAYKKAFREVLLSLAETQFEYFRNLEYTAQGVTPKGEKLVVARGMIKDTTGKLPDTVVAWRISTRPGKPIKIIDVEVENISMLITQQQENTAIIRQNGGKFSALIDALEKMAEDIKNGEMTTE